MNTLFNPDNAFFSFMGKAFDMFIINLLWLVLCIPIVTIVPATTAMYYVIVKVIRRERSYAVKEFFRSFKRNFRQGSIYSILGVVAVFVMYIDFKYALQMAEEGNDMGSTYFGIFLVVAILLSAVFAYLCPVLSRFEMKFWGLLKTSFYMATRHFPTTFVLLVLLVAVLLGCYLVVPGIFVLPVVGTLLASFLLERVFKQYMPAKEENKGENAEENHERDEWYLE